jgi:3',5'-cyclic AMP phosphodiesterase CpdA
MTSSRIVIAQITDTHIRAPGRLTYRKIDTSSYLRAAVAFLASPPVPVDAVVHTGDLTDFATDDEYRHFRDIVAPLRVPFYALPGNHDERNAFRRAFGEFDLPAEGPLNYVVSVGDLQVVMLDSVVPGSPYGELGPATLTWLDRTLGAAEDRPALVALHHPPFMTGIRHMDVQNCRDACELEEVLRRHPGVKGLLCGHVHRTVMTLFADRPAMIGPSPAHAVSLDLSPDAPPSFTIEPPALLLHVWSGGSAAQLTSHWTPIGRFDGPHPFFDAAGRLID